MKKSMHIFLYIGGGLLILLLVWVGKSLFSHNNMPLEQERILGSYVCGKAEVRLIYFYDKGMFGSTAPSEGMLFEFEMNGSTTRTASVSSKYPGWSSPQFPLYAAPTTLLRTFPGFIFTRGLVWNIFIDVKAESGELPLANALSEYDFKVFSDCLVQHFSVINSALTSFVPTISSFENGPPRSINSITNASLDATRSSTHFSCDLDELQGGPLHSVTMVLEGDTYNPTIVLAQGEWYEDINFRGNWTLRMPKSYEDNIPTITEIRDCKNDRGEMLGMYIDGFTKSFASLNLPSE